MSLSPLFAKPQSPVIEREEDLFAIFEGSFRPNDSLVGIECERIGMFSDGQPLRFHHHPGVREVFTELAERYGWQPQPEYPGAPVLSLGREGASVTLEPGSQFELSGAPFATVHEVAHELKVHREEVNAIAEPLGLNFLGVGLHPFAKQSDLDWVPKGRYPIMSEYLPTRGRYGLDMMRRTATVQANFDYSSERDAMRKLRVSLALSPVLTALFANSPVLEGQRLDIKSHRARVWLDMDNDRAGLLPFAWSPDATLGDYIRWALNVPMFILKRGTVVTRATDFTFGRFMREGILGQRPIQSDWETHLNTLFPEVRLKRTIEVRGADSVPLRFATALPALWTALLYDKDALDAAAAAVLPYGLGAWTAVRPRIAELGLNAQMADTTIGAIARDLIAIAERSLAKRDKRDALGRDERMYLSGIAELAQNNLSVGDCLFDGWRPDSPDAVASLIKRTLF